MGLILARPTAAQTGLEFPSNDDPDGVVRFQLTGAALPNIQPLTIIWRVYPVQQTGYYTTFFHARTDGSFTGDHTYFGCHPYPQGGASGTVHNWEISIEGADDIVDENANSTVVTKDQWYIQAAVSRVADSQSTVDFYWSLPDTNKIISHTTLGQILSNNANSPGLIFGDAPWAENNERLSGILRGIQVYTAVLSEADILTEAANHTSNTPQTAAGLANVHYMNQNPTPDDISDKSGNGNNPAWVNANRPTLWTG